MLLELCVTELEDVALDTECGRSAMQPVIQESAHPYADDTINSGHVKIPGRATKAWFILNVNAIRVLMSQTRNK